MSLPHREIRQGANEPGARNSCARDDAGRKTVIGRRRPASPMLKTPPAVTRLTPPADLPAGAPRPLKGEPRASQITDGDRRDAGMRRRRMRHGSAAGGAAADLAPGVRERRRDGESDG